MEILITVCHIIIIPFLAVSAYLLMEKRFSKAATAAVLSVECLICTSLYFLFIHNKSIAPFSTILLAVNVLLTMMFSFYLTRHQDGRHLFNMLTASAFSMLGGSAGGCIYLLTGSIVLYLLSTIFIYLVLLFFLAKIYRGPVLELMEQTKKGWVALSAIPVSFIILNYLLSARPVSLRENPSNIPAVLFLSVFLFLIYILIYQFCRLLRRSYMAEHDYNLLELQIQTMNEKTQEQLAAEEHGRIFRHDLRHYGVILSSCLDSGNLDEARSILEKMTALAEPPLKGKTYCANLYINSVLANYAEKAEQAQIKMEVTVELPASLPVDPLEFSIFLSNGLENSVNACLEIPEPEKRNISLNCRYIHGQLFVMYTNSYMGELVFDKESGLPLTTHGAGHGLGSRSMLAFIRKYGAITECTAENGIFMLNMLVNDGNSCDDGPA